MAHREGGGPHPYRSVECGRSDPVIHSAPLSKNSRRYSGARDDSQEISAIKKLGHKEKKVSRRCRDNSHLEFIPPGSEELTHWGRRSLGLQARRKDNRNAVSAHGLAQILGPDGRGLVIRFEEADRGLAVFLREAFHDPAPALDRV